jgi:multicomponent Na+:H+ antiporter subunit D
MQTGLCVALVGVGTPLALAAAEGHAFAAILSFVALQLMLGAALERHGSVRISQLAGVGRTMPISALLLIGCGLAVSAAPALVMFASQAAALEATAQWDLRWLWLVIWASPAVLLVSLLLRPALAAYTPLRDVRPIREAPFSMLLGAGLALFLCFAVGLAPRWLFDLMPAEIAFQPFVLDRIAPQLQLLGAAGVAFLALRATRIVPREQGVELLDIDAMYRGPLAQAGTWAGVLALRVYGAWQSWTRRVSGAAGRGLQVLAAACDRPYAPAGTAAVTLFCLGAVLWVMFLVR